MNFVKNINMMLDHDISLSLIYSNLGNLKTSYKLIEDIYKLNPEHNIHL